MNIRQLKIFKAVCEEESITKAAEKLYISQPAVSITIKELEDTVGFSLFERISGKIYLNERGKQLLIKTNEFLLTYENLLSETKDIKTKSPIRIGSSITIANDQLSHYVKEFNEFYPDVKIIVTINNAHVIEQMVNNNELDFGLIEGVQSNADLVKHFITGFNMVFLCSNDHELSKKSRVKLQDLTDENFLLREKGSAIRQLFESIVRLENMRIEPLWTSTNSQVLLQGVINNIGITVLPKSIVKGHIERNEVSIIKLNKVNLINNAYLIHQKDKVFDEKLLQLKHIILNVRD